MRFPVGLVHPTRRSFLKISRVLAATVLAVTTMVTAPKAMESAQAASKAGRKISRAEMTSRAKYWVDHQPRPYNQMAYSFSVGRDIRYRRDCSGYVSMAWHLKSSPNSAGLVRYGVKPGTSPAIANLGSTYRIAFQGNQSGRLWTVGDQDKGRESRHGMDAGSSPTISR